MDIYKIKNYYLKDLTEAFGFSMVLYYIYNFTLLTLLKIFLTIFIVFIILQKFKINNIKQYGGIGLGFLMINSIKNRYK